jgi:hypothetical protein
MVVCVGGFFLKFLMLFFCCFCFLYLFAKNMQVEHEYISTRNTTTANANVGVTDVVVAQTRFDCYSSTKGIAKSIWKQEHGTFNDNSSIDQI